jgi:hypothetical protein
MKWKNRILQKLKKDITLNPSPKERDFLITDFTNPVQFESGFLLFKFAALTLKKKEFL